MSSSVNSPDPDQHPLAAAGGIATAPSQVKDPFAELDDLMVVIEALCPTWPQRELFTTTGDWRL
jgi:hypothetical protein